MIANSAFLAATVTVLLAAMTIQEVAYLAPYRRVILAECLPILTAAFLLVFLNLFAAFYALSRWLFLKDTGRKLAHVDRQLWTSDTIVRDLSSRLAQDE